MGPFRSFSYTDPWGSPRTVPSNGDRLDVFLRVWGPVPFRSASFRLVLLRSLPALAEH